MCPHSTVHSPSVSLTISLSCTGTLPFFRKKEKLLHPICRTVKYFDFILSSKYVPYKSRARYEQTKKEPKSHLLLGSFLGLSRDLGGHRVGDSSSLRACRPRRRDHRPCCPCVCPRAYSKRSGSRPAYMYESQCICQYPSFDILNESMHTCLLTYKKHTQI